MGMPQTAVDRDRRDSRLSRRSARGPLNNTKWGGERSRRDDGAQYRATWCTRSSTGRTCARRHGQELHLELPVEGETEIWEIVNLTADAIPSTCTWSSSS